MALDLFVSVCVCVCVCVAQGKIAQIQNWHFVSTCTDDEQ